MNNDDFNRGVFEGEVLAELKAIKKLGDEVKVCLENQDKRITKLEMDLLWSKGIIVGIGAVSGFLSAHLTKYVSIFFKNPPTP